MSGVGRGVIIHVQELLSEFEVSRCFISCDVFRFDENWCVDVNTVYYDSAEFARQIGMLPPRDSAADRATLTAFNAKTRMSAKIKSLIEARRA